jgi:predicted nucleic acid-binding protein
MTYLLDTGILLRLTNKDDPQHEAVSLAIQRLGDRRRSLVTTSQNISELWNVATRPSELNGLGFSVESVATSLSLTIEPLCTVTREHSQHYKELKRLLRSYQVLGKQVHDARLVASMLTWKISTILTLNARHFKRFEQEGILIATPETVLTDE